MCRYSLLLFLLLGCSGKTDPLKSSAGSAEPAHEGEPQSDAELRLAKIIRDTTPDADSIRWDRWGPNASAEKVLSVLRKSPLKPEDTLKEMAGAAAFVRLRHRYRLGGGWRIDDFVYAVGAGRTGCKALCQGSDDWFERWEKEMMPSPPLDHP